jgi:hypothetical protein
MAISPMSTGHPAWGLAELVVRRDTTLDEPAIELVVEAVDGLYAVVRKDLDGMSRVVLLQLQSPGANAVIAFPQIVSLVPRTISALTAPHV